MTKDEKILCLAMVLGDGYIRKDCPGLRISHSPEQKDYMDWKADILEKAVGKPVTITKVVHKHSNGQEYPGYQLGISHRFFRILRNRCYREDKPYFTRELLNKLTPKALAIWYMDDGSLYPKKRNGKIHAYELVLSICTDEEKANIAKDYFESVWGISFTIKRNKGLCSIRCGTIEARKFIALVQPFVVPSLAHKVNM